MVDDPIASPDTLATLLLCGRFKKGAAGSEKPLTVSEYNLVAKWLKDRGLTPADLLEPVGHHPLDSFDVPKLDRNRIIYLLGRGAELALMMEKWSRAGIWVVGRSEAHYPVILKQRIGISTAPIFFGVGNKKLLSAKGVCIVGSRDVSDDGLDFAAKVAQRCARNNHAVISGNARGVDQESMMSAYRSGGAVVGILSDNLLKAALHGVHREPLQSGRMVLASPYSPEVPFNVGNAMGRNKYLYALSSFAVIVASGTRGGTWEGALENKNNAWVDAFIRLSDKVPEGNLALARHGLRPLEFAEELDFESDAGEVRNTDIQTAFVFNN